MPAKKVYGVAIGESRRSPEGEIFEILEFITPVSPSGPWEAKIKAHNKPEAKANVSDLKTWGVVE